MFFRSIIRLSQVLLIATSLAACGLKIGEKAPMDKPIVIGGSGFSCLSHISEQLDLFFAARLKPAEIRNFVGCIRYSLESFAKHARGLEKNVFRPEEVRDFLQEYFLKDKVISNQLMADFMVIKQALVGGSVDAINRTDLNQAIGFLSFLEEQAVRLNPHMHIYNFNVGRLMIVDKKNQPEVVVAVDLLNEVAMAIGQRLAQASAPYPLARLESFMREFRSFSGWDEIFTNSRRPESWTTFISAYKSVVAGSDGEKIRPQDWPQMFSVAAGIYGLSLKARYARERQSLFSEEGLEGVVRVADDVVRLLQVTVDQQPKKVVTYAQLDRLVDSLEPLGLMPRVPSADATGGRAIKAVSFKKLLRALFDKILGDPQINWRVRTSLGLTRLGINQAADEFARWAEVQRFLDRTFPDHDKSAAGGGRVETLSDRLGPIGASQTLMRLLGEGSTPKDNVVGLVRLMEQSMRPLFRPGEDQIFLTESSLLAKYQLVHGFHNLSMMNLSRAAIALVARGYSTYRGKGEGPFDGGITDDEMQAFYMDMRDFGVDLQLFDPRSENAGYRSFQEANMFTYTGNGLQRLSEVKDPKEAMLTYPEGMEYLLFIISGGTMGQAIYSKLMSEGGLCAEQSRDGPISVHQYRMVERNCFRQKLMQVLLPRLTTMPTMQAELQRASPAEKLAVVDDLMSAVYSHKFGNPKFIEWQEINTIAVIMHYTESVMTRYNVNQDNFLDSSEVWQAYETFAVYMQQMAKERCIDMVNSWNHPDSPEAQAQRIAASKYGSSAIKEGLKRWIASNGCENIPHFVSEAVFSHLVVNGKVPESLWEINYLPRAPLIGTDFKVDRAALLRVFAALVKANSESAKPSNLK